jgi:hypothetical protein
MGLGGWRSLDRVGLVIFVGAGGDVGLERLLAVNSKAKNGVIVSDPCFQRGWRVRSGGDDVLVIGGDGGENASFASGGGDLGPGDWGEELRPMTSTFPTTSPSPRASDGLREACPCVDPCNCVYVWVSFADCGAVPAGVSMGGEGAAETAEETLAVFGSDW